MTTSETEAAPEAAAKRERVFLVVVDDTPELKVALRFAAKRAARTGGRVALLSVAEPADFQHWQTVGELMRAEAREASERLLERCAAEVEAIAKQRPVLFIREGSRRDELMKLIQSEPTISILVLAASGGDDPGPLVTHLMRRQVGKLRIPVTIVPGTLGDEEVDAIT